MEKERQVVAAAAAAAIVAAVAAAAIKVLATVAPTTALEAVAGVRHHGLRAQRKLELMYQQKQEEKVATAENFQKREK